MVKPKTPIFAQIPQNLAYWKKQEKPLFEDCKWNIPEQKTGRVAVVGGNVQAFSAVVKMTEELMVDFPVKSAEMILPEALRGKLPILENATFLPATTSGSFSRSPLLVQNLERADFVLMAGDLTKNSETTVALAEALGQLEMPILLARDSLDTLLPEMSALINHGQLFILASLAQLQKLFRTLYYPKVLMLSMPLLAVIETLHKFTLSYPVTIVTFHADEIIVAQGGKIVTTNIALTNYMPLTLWSGTLAVKIAALNLYNPKKMIEATTAAIF